MTTKGLRDIVGLVARYRELYGANIFARVRAVHRASDPRHPVFLDVTDTESVSRGLFPEGSRSRPNGPDFIGVCSLGAWTMGKGVYRFDRDVWDLLGDSGVETLPVSALLTPPEWGVYIETPPGSAEPALYRGLGGVLLSTLGVTDGAGTSTVLTMLPVGGSKGFRGGVPLNLGVTTVGDAIAEFEEFYHRTVADDRLLVDRLRRLGMAQAAYLSAVKGLVREVIPRYAYLCCENGELRRTEAVRDTARGFTPRRPAKGKRPEDVETDPVEIEVGYRLGALLRRAADRATVTVSSGDGTRTVRPHPRGAHWQTYWTGPKDGPGERRKVTRWKAPVYVNEHLLGDRDRDALPNVRKVSGDDARDEV